MGPLFVGIMRLVTDIMKERIDYSLEMGGTGTCDNLDVFPKING